VTTGTVLLRGDDDEPVVATGGGLADPVTWSRGSTIHAGPDRIDAGVTVHGFVRTSSGFVVMGGNGAVWSVTDAGPVRVGEVGSQLRLVADRNGTLAAWTAPSGALEILDQHTGRVRAVVGPGVATDDAGVLALDGRTVYWRNRGRVVASDADTGRTRTLSSGRLQLFDAKGGVLAFADATRDLKVGTTLEDATPLIAWSLDSHGGDEPVLLSPTGQWVAVARIRVSGSGDEQDIDAHLDVYDSRSHAVTTLDLPGGPWVAVPGAWLGDATLEVLGLLGSQPFKGDSVDPVLFTCTLTTESCTRTADVGRVGSGAAVATLPDGRWTSD
jgi:hypothetical protein